MFTPMLQGVLISPAKIENREFRDRVTGQVRAYSTCTLSVLADDSFCIVSVPEHVHGLRDAVSKLGKGNVSLLISAFEIDKEVVRATLAGVVEEGAGF